MAGRVHLRFWVFHVYFVLVFRAHRAASFTFARGQQTQFGPSASTSRCAPPSRSLPREKHHPHRPLAPESLTVISPGTVLFPVPHSQWVTGSALDLFAVSQSLSSPSPWGCPLQTVSHVPSPTGFQPSLPGGAPGRIWDGGRKRVVLPFSLCLSHWLHLLCGSSPPPSPFVRLLPCAVRSPLQD